MGMQNPDGKKNGLKSLPRAAPMPVKDASSSSSVHPVEILINTDFSGPRKEALLFRVPLNNTTSFGPTDLAIEFTNGVFAGFGTPLTDACVGEDEVFSKMIDAAAKAAAGGSIAGISIALEILVRAYKLQLPKLEKECGPEVQQALGEVEDALNTIHSPQEFVWYVEKNVQINRVQIMEELQNFAMDIPHGKFEDAGENIGKMLKQVLVGADKAVDNGDDAPDDVSSASITGTAGSQSVVQRFMSVFV